MLVLVEPTGSGASIIREDSSFTTTRIAGNLMLVTNPYASHPIFVGGDSSGPEYARYGDLELHHNTIVINSGTWRVNLPTVLSNVSVDFRNNIVWRQGSEIIRLMGGAGILNSGANWISPGWESGPDALFSGVASILPETINDPLLDSDFVPLEGSPARDSGGNALVNFQYHETASGSLRPVVCSGSDLGAFEAGSHSPNLEPILDGKVFSGGFAIWLNGNPNTGYLIEWSDDFVNWQTLGAGTTDEKGTLLMVDPSHPITTHRFYRAQ